MRFGEGYVDIVIKYDAITDQSRLNSFHKLSNFSQKKNSQAYCSLIWSIKDLKLRFYFENRSLL